MGVPRAAIAALLLPLAAARGQEDQAAALAEASAEAAAADGTLALLLAREAFEAADIEPARTALYAAIERSRERAILRGHEGAVVHVDLSPDGSAVSTASEDGTARLWTADGRQTAVLAAGAPVREARLLGGPDRVLVVTAEGLSIWDGAGRKLASFPPAPFEVRGPMLAMRPAAEDLHLVDADGKLLKDLKARASGPAAGEFAFWAVTPDGKLRWYDARGREKVVTPAPGVTRAVFAEEAPLLATFGTGIAVELWSPQCRKLGELLHAGPVEQVSVSPKGDRIFTASADGNYAFWGADGKRQGRIEKPGPCLFAKVSEDGARVVTLDDRDRVTLWTWDGKPLEKRFEGIARVDPNRACLGLIVDTGDGARRFVQSALAEVDSAALVGTLSSSRWSNGGDWLFVGSEEGRAALQHWYGAGPAPLDGHAGAVLCASFSADDTLVATASRDGTARVWDVDPRGVPVLRHPDRVTGLGFTRGRLLACSDRMLHLREPDGRVVREVALPAPVVWWGHGEGRVAVACKGEPLARLYDDAGKEVAQLRHEGVVNGVEVAPKGDLVVTFSADGTARLWDARGRPRTTLGHPKGVGSAAFSADGSLLLTTAEDRQARIWTAQGKLKATFRVPEEVWYCVFSPRGDRIIGIPTKASVARVWGPGGEQVAELLGHEGPVRGASFSPEGDAIVTGSADGTARLWDADGRPGRALPHPDEVYKGAFLPGGAGVVTTCKDGAVRHWDRDGNLLAVLRGHARAVWFVECAKDGATLATASEDTTVRLWPLRREDLLRVAKERSIRDFAPEERERYGALLTSRD